MKVWIDYENLRKMQDDYQNAHFKGVLSVNKRYLIRIVIK